MRVLKEKLNIIDQSYFLSACFFILAFTRVEYVNLYTILALVISGLRV